jgi:DNA-directed RNA polymerase subunit RPC12/RpoP
MSVIALKVTRAPSSTNVHQAPATIKPLFRGNGGTDYVCGNCAAVIASAMGPTQHVIVDQTICSACGAENEFPVELRA